MNIDKAIDRLGEKAVAAVAADHFRRRAAGEDMRTPAQKKAAKLLASFEVGKIVEWDRRAAGRTEVTIIRGEVVEVDNGGLIVVRADSGELVRLVPKMLRVVSLS